MRLRSNFAIVFAAMCSLASGASFSFHVIGDSPGSWPAVLSSVGLIDGALAGAEVVVAPAGTKADAKEWTPWVDKGGVLILEGASPLAAEFGFEPGGKQHILARAVEDVHAPKLHIVWEQPLELPVFEIPREARVFARERWQSVPLIAGFRRGAGAILWVAAPLGMQGYERFPYILQALTDLGFEAPFRSARLWAFFDSAYRSRVDPDYFAARWHAAGISALQVAAWHYWEADPQADEYLRRLIAACHRQAISVYAWLELPNVSEKFWNDHPEWREKTALLQDAQLDWRKLMNLTNREAFAAVAAGVRELTARFDWDGVNLAELYFESLEGHDNAARFTPMNADVRAEFRQKGGFDPLELFDPKSARHYSNNTAGLSQFLEFRAELARRQQTEWIAQVEAIRKNRPQLDLTLTHVDDRFDATMREKIGADASRLLPMLSQHDFTFLIEDPATVWNLGPQRYPQIAARYRSLTPAQDKLAIDINIVERYQDVYPTKQQTGTELFELVHAAAAAFPRVALYFENSIAKQDWPLLASAASTVNRVERVGGKLVVDSLRGTGVPWSGPATVDGKPWPFANDTTVWLPPGMHAIEAAKLQPASRLLEFNGELKSATAIAGGIEFSYQSSARAFAKLERVPRKLEIDGLETTPEFAGEILILPRGQHLVTATGAVIPAPDKKSGR